MPPISVGASASVAGGPVPTFAQVNGYALGSKQATTAELDTYFAAVAKASDRVRLHTMGASAQGHPLRYVVVSHPDNLVRLEQLKQVAQQLRDAPTSADAGARTARDLPAFVVLLPNVHGNEPSGSDALMQVLFDLASGRDAATLARLRSLVVVIMATQNPDGREGGFRTSAHGFDLNRDWFSLTQPETRPKIDLYREFPAVLGMDLHEQFLQGNEAFYFPPNADPVHHESSRPGVDASNTVVSPAVAKAFDAKGYTYSHYGIYDLFAPIYGDVVPNHAFGASGFILEMENENAYPDKFARTYTAVDAALGAVVAHRPALLDAWARQWPQARDQGAAGALSKNVVQDPGARAALPVPATRVYGYALLPGRREGDRAHLVERLLAYGVRAYVTTKAVKAPALQRFGASARRAATLPAGTVVIPAAQPMKHWVHILLADDPHASVNYFYDVSGWGNPLLMALDGGALGAPVQPWMSRGGDGSPAVLRRVSAPADLAGPPPARSATAYAFAADSAIGQAVLFRLLAQGVTVRRTTKAVAGLPAGAAVVPATARAPLLALTRPRGIAVVTLAAIPAGLVTPRRPKVALVHDLVSDKAQQLFARSSGFAQWLLQSRFGLDVTLVLANQIDAGTLTTGGFAAVVVPDGFSTVLPAGAPNVDASPPAAGITPAGLAEINLFVRTGGTYVGWCSQGISTAMAAGIAGTLTSSVPLSGVLVPGSPFGVQVHTGDPATLGVTGFSTVYNVRDPILSGGGPALVSYPAAVRSYGYAEGVSSYAGSPAATGQQVGQGRVYVCAFDPAFRGWSEATQALVGNMLLAPAATGNGLLAAKPAPALLAQARPGRPTVIRVPSRHAGALRAVVASVPGLPDDARLAAGPGGSLELRAEDREPLSGHPAGWVRRALEALDRAGARPEVVLA